MSSEKSHPELPLVNPTVSPSKECRAGIGRRIFALVAAAVIGALVYLQIPNRLWLCHERTVPRTQAPPLGLPDKIQKRWGQYSPYFPAGEYIHPPSSCNIVQVNILQRHGARYPNEEDDYPKAVEHLLTAKEFRDANLKFLKHYEYRLPEEVLTPYGAEQSFEAGEAAQRRYGHLVGPHTLPFVRASGIDRVIKSAENWTVGFAASSKHHVNPTIDQILSESVNNTLNNDCPNAADGTKEKNEWLSVFAPPIVKRLKHAAKKAKVTEQDIHRLMALCPFETFAYERPSPFCSLFTTSEWEDLEYYGDVEKYYKTGYGNHLGAVQGVGYVNELLARLTGVPPRHDNTTHNHSLPFPLDRTLYADFTHENSMVAIFSAMGLFNVSDNPPSPKKMERTRNWTASLMVPFSARMVVEKLACDGEDGDDEGEDEEYVRIFVNDALQTLEFCDAESVRGRKNWEGMCSVKSFVKSQRYARMNGGGDFVKCYN